MERTANSPSFNFRRLRMLILSRLPKEKIVIGGNVVLTVIEVCKDRVRLGFEAPPEVSINRKEVEDAINKEKKS